MQKETNALIILYPLQGARSVDVYFPDATWFDYYTVSIFKMNFHTFSFTLFKIILFQQNNF